MPKNFRLWLKQRFHLTPGEFRLAMAGMVLFMAGALACVWSAVRTVRLAYEGQVLKKEERRLLQEMRMMKLEKESLQSLYRIESLARNKLGMNDPANHQVVTIFLKNP